MDARQHGMVRGWHLLPLFAILIWSLLPAGWSITWLTREHPWPPTLVVGAENLDPRTTKVTIAISASPSRGRTGDGMDVVVTTSGTVPSTLPTLTVREPLGLALTDCESTVGVRIPVRHHVAEESVGGPEGDALAIFGPGGSVTQLTIPATVATEDASKVFSVHCTNVVHSLWSDVRDGRRLELPIVDTVVADTDSSAHEHLCLLSIPTTRSAEVFMGDDGAYVRGTTQPSPDPNNREYVYEEDVALPRGVDSTCVSEVSEGFQVWETSSTQRLRDTRLVLEGASLAWIAAALIALWRSPRGDDPPGELSLGPKHRARRRQV